MSIAPLPLAVALVMNACTVVGHEKVEGWPELTVTEHHVPHAVMRDKCSKYVPAGFSPDACMEFDLNKGTCDIWFSADFPPSQWMVEHERLHCKGYDHVGGETLRNALRAVGK